MGSLEKYARKGKLSIVIAIGLLFLIVPILIKTPNLGLPWTEGIPFSPDSSVSNALNYLKSIQQLNGCIENFATSSWATMAIAAAGEDPHTWAQNNDSIVDYLKANTNQLNLSTASDVERFILSMTAAKEAPRDINGTDYVAILKELFNNGQIGDKDWLFDDFWGIAALISAGTAANSTLIQETMQFIKTNQNLDGGWGWAVGAGSDVDDTAAAIMALIAAGEPENSNCVSKALDYLHENQQEDGGFPSWGVTNSASDSWAMGAICAMGQSPADWTKNDTSVVDHLLSLQNPNGSFNWTSSDPEWVNKALMTSYAITALCSKPYPVNGMHIYLRIEGSEKTIWREKVFVVASIIVDDQSQEHYFVDPTVLGALDKAAEVGGFNYKAEQTAYGLFVYSIAGEENAGVKGWLYRVNYYMPWVGADVFVLNETSPPSPPHEELLWYYGEWPDLPLKILVDKTEVFYGENITATVIYFNGTTECWYPLEGAEVHFLGRVYITNSSGCVTITVPWDPPIRAEKEGFIRSDKIEIKIKTTNTSYSVTSRRTFPL